MPEIPASPLTQDHLQQIRNSLDIITRAEYQVDLAKRAGIDVSSQEADLATAKQKLLQLKQVYFPGM